MTATATTVTTAIPRSEGTDSYPARRARASWWHAGTDSCPSQHGVFAVGHANVWSEGTDSCPAHTTRRAALQLGGVEKVLDVQALWSIAHRAWNKLMHAIHGNTTTTSATPTAKAGYYWHVGFSAWVGEGIIVLPCSPSDVWGGDPRTRRGPA